MLPGGDAPLLADPFLQKFRFRHAVGPIYSMPGAYAVDNLKQLDPTDTF